VLVPSAGWGSTPIPIPTPTPMNGEDAAARAKVPVPNTHAATRPFRTGSIQGGVASGGSRESDGGSFSGRGGINLPRALTNRTADGLDSLDSGAYSLPGARPMDPCKVSSSMRRSLL
jgi:hypothetical protein